MRKGKLSNKEIKTIARIHAAISVQSTDVFMFEEETIVMEEDQLKILEEMQLLAFRIAGNHPTNLGSTSEIVDYATRQPFKK